MEVYSMQGEKEMGETIIGQKQLDFRFSEMAAGLYFIMIIAEGYVETKKLIKL
jgi:hypothetical protein